jgi:RNA polymerase sigma-70 factor (ECF subfamily)
MSTGSQDAKSARLDTLLDRLTSGDAAAAEEVFTTYEPYLRMVVRRMLPGHLRSKFDSVDIVQSVWGDLLRGFREAGWRFASTDHLKAFLIRATRNRFLTRQQKYQSRGEANHSVDNVDQLISLQPDPLETAHAEELWALLLASCSHSQRPLVEMKRAGYSLQEIAEKTGYHPSSIRRVFYDLARRTSLQSSLPDDSSR